MTRQFVGSLVTLLCLLMLAAAPLRAEGIEGGRERRGFEPGERVIYEAALASCPVGEFLDEWRVLRSSCECARFAGRIWLRPLASGTLIWLPLAGLPEEWSLEFTVHSFEPGRPMLQFSLHSPKGRQDLENGSVGAYESGVLIGGIIAVGEPSRFGARETGEGSLEGRWEFSRMLEPGRDHQIALQIRRGQLRFFVDGDAVGHKPFRPAVPIEALSLYFRHTGHTDLPYADAPVLVTGIRLATYERPEEAPQPEQDLIRELGAAETERGLEVVLGEAILFDFGRWQLRPEAQAILEQLARLAALRPGPVLVEGHTDNVGSERFNLVLSELRAHVVGLELARLGVDPDRLQPVGRSESEPVAPNDSEEGRARNRRVVVIFEKG